MPYTKEERERVRQIEAGDRKDVLKNGRALGSEEIDMDPDRVEERITVRLSRTDTRRMDAICKERGIGRSAFLRMAARRLLREEASVQGEARKMPTLSEDAWEQIAQDAVTAARTILKSSAVIVSSTTGESFESAMTKLLRDPQKETRAEAAKK